MLVCMCGLACCACCGVLQRRHNFEAFLQRFGKRQSHVLVRHWLGTATRNKPVWTFACPMTLPITVKFKAAKNTEKKGLQLLRGWRAPKGAKNTLICSAAYSADLRRQMLAFTFAGGETEAANTKICIPVAEFPQGISVNVVSNESTPFLIGLDVLREYGCAIDYHYNRVYSRFLKRYLPCAILPTRHLALEVLPSNSE